MGGGGGEINLLMLARCPCTAEGIEGHYIYNVNEKKKQPVKVRNSSAR